MSKKRYQSEKLNVIEEELNTLFTAEFLENHTSGHFFTECTKSSFRSFDCASLIPCIRLLCEIKQVG